MPRLDKHSPADAAKRSLLDKAVNKLRTAPSPAEGVKEIARSAIRTALGRLPASEKAIRQAKTEYWQQESNAAYFTTNADAATKPMAGYMDAVINEFFLKHCPPNARVLDVGCGHGVVSLFLARNGLSVTAFDASEPLLKVLESKSAGLNIRIQRGDAYDMPFADGEFDVVVSRMFLMQFSDWTKILREMARCCRRGGQLLIHFTSAENANLAETSCPHECEFGEVIRAKQVRNHTPSAFCGAFDQRTIDKACRSAGLRLRERAPCMFFHYNRLIGHSLGTEKFIEYRTQLEERLKDPKTLDFVAWFEKTVVQNMPALASYYNILVLEKE